MGRGQILRNQRLGRPGSRGRGGHVGGRGRGGNPNGGSSNHGNVRRDIIMEGEEHPVGSRHDDENDCNDDTDQENDDDDDDDEWMDQRMAADNNNTEYGAAHEQLSLRSDALLAAPSSDTSSRTTVAKGEMNVLGFAKCLRGIRVSSRLKIPEHLAHRLVERSVIRNHGDGETHERTVGDERYHMVPSSADKLTKTAVANQTIRSKDSSTSTETGIPSDCDTNNNNVVVDNDASRNDNNPHPKDHQKEDTEEDADDLDAWLDSVIT